MGLSFTGRVARRFVASICLPVPIVPQTADFSCGSAALFGSLLYWKGDQKSPDHEADLWGPLDIDKEAGAEPEQIAAVARRFGLKAQAFQGMTQKHLRRCLDVGATVILCLQAWRQRPVRWIADWEDGHYVVLIGMDADRAFFMDPATATAYTWMTFADLHERWHSPDPEGMPQWGVGIVIRGTTPAVRAFPGPFKPLP